MASTLQKNTAPRKNEKRTTTFLLCENKSEENISNTIARFHGTQPNSCDDVKNLHFSKKICKIFETVVCHCVV